MIIGIEAERANAPQKTGVEHYAKQLIVHLAKIDPVNRYILYLRTKPQAWFLNLPKNFEVKVIPFPFFWTQVRLSWEMLFHPVEALFIPASAMPLIHPKKCVTTIHDLAWKFYPETFTWFNRNFLEWSTRVAVKSASSVIAVSESTKKDLVKFYNIDEKKIFVIHHGYEETLNSKSENLNKSQNLNSKIQIDGNYILFLSTLQPRKNLANLIDAFKLLKKEQPMLAGKLLVIGRKGWKFESIIQKIEENKDVVQYLDYVNDETRLSFFKKAKLMVLPSFYEGFGMTILEAFAVGTPVATSNTSSMPEVAGDAALYFDPHNIDEIKNVILKILTEQDLRQRLIQKGQERLQNFSWEKCAQQTLKVLLK